MDNDSLEHKISKTEFSLFMRQLHILALVQHSSSSENMNYRTMADLLNLVPWDEDIDDKKIGRCVKFLKDIGFPVHTSRGETRVVLDRELTKEEMLEVLPYYLNVVSETVGIRDCFKSYVQNHGSRSLWIIGRIYFASLQKKRIELTYRPLKSSEPDKYQLNPYMWIYRDNAVYLVAKKSGGSISLFRLNRIRDVVIKNENFDDEIPSAEELMKHSMGAFIGSRIYRIRLRFHDSLKDMVEETFGHLEPVFEHNDGEDETDAVFSASDIGTVCQAVFGYSGSVRIVEPEEALKEMKRMIDGIKWL